MGKAVIATDDGRFVKKIDTWTGSPKVIFELTDKREKALVYPTLKRAEEDCELMNRETKRFGKIRRFIVGKYGDIQFHPEAV